MFTFTIKREICERNVPKGVLLERFHSRGQQPCKFIETPTWPPFCCIVTPKWRTWRNRLLETLILLFFYYFYYLTYQSLLSQSCLRKLPNHVATSSACIVSFVAHLNKKLNVCKQRVSLSLLTVTLPSWLLSCLISNVFTTVQYNTVKNTESRHHWSKKSMWRQCICIDK